MSKNNADEFTKIVNDISILKTKEFIYFNRYW